MKEMTTSKFTDDDLKRLKELDEVASIHDKYGNEEIRKLVHYLLARMEAAEKCIPYHECQDDLSACPHLLKWRKSKGEPK